MTDEEVMKELGSKSPLDLARQAFSAECGRIEQACMQKRRPSPIEVRRMEFMAAKKIAAALGVTLP